MGYGSKRKNAERKNYKRDAEFLGENGVCHGLIYFSARMANAQRRRPYGRRLFLFYGLLILLHLSIRTILLHFLELFFNTFFDLCLLFFFKHHFGFADDPLFSVKNQVAGDENENEQ